MVLIINTMTQTIIALFIWSFRQRPTGNRYYKFSGPRFADVDNRLMSLQLVKTEWLMRLCLILKAKHTSGSILYKKNILALRGSFRPVTKVNMDMYEKSLRCFLKIKVEKEKTHWLFWNYPIKLTFRWWNWRTRFHGQSWITLFTGTNGNDFKFPGIL
jgi:hypothetical protein